MTSPVLKKASRRSPARLIPIPTEIQLQVTKNLKERGKKRGKFSLNAKKPEARYRRQLTSLSKALQKGAREILAPELILLQPEYVTDAYAATLAATFLRLESFYGQFEPLAQQLAQDFTITTSIANRERFHRQVQKGIGVDLNMIIQSEGIEDILIGTTRENVNLIKSIPQEYFKNLESIVWTGTTQGNAARSMLQQIRDLGHSTDNRARLIARDQSAKLNSAINQQRQTNLGVEEYVWRTVGDERVRETHKAHNGKTFRWDDPPKDTGHPGQDIQCRCIAQPVIRL